MDRQASKAKGRPKPEAAFSGNREGLPEPEHYYHRALALEEQGRLAEALENYRHALEIRADFPEVHNNLAIIHQAQGQFDAALAAYRRAVEIAPSFAMAHANLGNLLKSLGQTDAALASYRQALAIQPDYIMALVNLGATLRETGKLDEAQAAYRRVLEINPEFAVAYCNLADMLNEAGKPEEALANCRQAIRLSPGLAEARNIEGNILKKMGCFGEALASYRHALEIRPDYVEALSNLGCALREAGQPENAVAHFRGVLERYPLFAKGWYNLGVAWQDMGMLEEALASYRRALELEPGLTCAHSNLLCVMNYLADTPDAEILAAAREYGRRFNVCQAARHVNERNPEKRLRIGYVSPDFRHHAVAYFAEPILSRHDRRQFEVTCYAEVWREDAYTERFRNLSDHWRNTIALSDEAMERVIREDRIDILVDLAGHTAGNRLPVFGRKPAPVQMTWLGYPGTTGLSAMDYRLTDRHTDPEGEADGRYVEKLLRLPDSLWCYRPSPDMPEVTPLPVLTHGYLTFGSFNNFNKIDRDTLALWAGLLRRMPDARLMMLTVPEGEARVRLLNDFAALGVGAQRLELHGTLPMDAFHRQFLKADIALDPVNVNGGTTTCEALWMGLPVISLTGRRFLSRAGLSMLRTVGMADFAAATSQDYLRVAAYLNENRELLAEIRANLRGYMAASPLADEATFTRHLEGIFRDVWRKWCGSGTVQQLPT